MDSHAVAYRVHGTSMQFVEIELDPGESVIAEAGALMYMEDDITFEARMGDGSSSGVMGSLLGAARRLLTRESLFMTHFSNAGSGKRRVALAAPCPGQVVPVDLSAAGGEILCQKAAFLCAAKGTRISVGFSRRLGAGFFGGEGFILQKLGGDGMAFVHAGGTVVEKQLAGDTLRVDTGCIVAFETGVEYDIALAGGLRSMMFGGEGLFLATLAGHGKVWLQSMPFSRFADAVIEHLPQSSRGADDD